MPKYPAPAKGRTKGKKKDYKKYLSILSLFILSLGFLGFYSFFKQFNKAFIFADTSESHDLSSDSYSVALFTLEDSFSASSPKLKNIKILVVKSDSSESILLDIPVNTKLDMPGKYGEEELSAALALGMLNSASLSGDCDDACFGKSIAFVISSLKLLTGMTVDKWILVEPELHDFSESLLFRSKPTSFFDRNNISLLASSMKTNFKFSEFIRYYNIVRTLNQSSIKNLTFSVSDLFDNNLRELNYNSALAAEKFSIAVLNATKTPGVASYGARVVENAGGHVTSMENASQVAEETFIISDDLNSATVSYLADYFDVENLYLKKEAPFADSPIDRADVTLVIGIDFLPNY